MRKKSIPPERAMWKFVMHASLGEIDTYLWHRQGSNQFCWRPIVKYSGRSEYDGGRRPMAE